MKYKTIFLIIAALLFLSACPDSPTDPQGENPYKQEAIDWPSLADSPWPMYHGSPLVNGLSFNAGPVKRSIEWKLDIIADGNGIVVDDSGYIFISNSNGEFFKINNTGNIVWERDLVDEYISEPGAPLLLSDQKIFVHLGKWAFLLTSDGTVEKSYNLPGYVDMPSFQIDKDGNLYSITREGSLFKMNQDGEELWNIFPPDSLNDYFAQSIFIPLFTQDASKLIVAGNNNIYGVNIDGIINWHFPLNVSAPPIITYNGYIYVYSHSDSTLNCLSEFGELIWSSELDTSIHIQGLSRPAVTKEGEIIFATYSPPGAVKFSPEGELIWKVELPIRVGYVNYVCSELVTDIEGNLYISTFNGSFYTVSNNGSIVSEIGNDLIVGMSPAIGKDVLYFTSEHYISRGVYAVQ